MSVEAIASMINQLIVDENYWLNSLIIHWIVEELLHQTDALNNYELLDVNQIFTLLR